MKRYKKPNRHYNKRPFFRKRSFWLSLSVVFILAIAFYIFVLFDFFQIKNIQIEGNQEVPAEKIYSLIEDGIKKKIIFFNSQSIFLADLEKAEKSLLEIFPPIKKVSFDRKFPDKLIVSIEERKPSAIFYQHDKYFFIDQEGDS